MHSGAAGHQQEVSKPPEDAAITESKAQLLNGSYF